MEVELKSFQNRWDLDYFVNSPSNDSCGLLRASRGTRVFKGDTKIPWNIHWHEQNGDFGMTERPKFGDFGTHVIEMVTFGNDGLGCKMAIRKKMVFWAKMCVIWRFCPYKRDIWLFWEGIKISEFWNVQLWIYISYNIYIPKHDVNNPDHFDSTSRISYFVHVPWR